MELVSASQDSPVLTVLFQHALPLALEMDNVFQLELR